MKKTTSLIIFFLVIIIMSPGCSNQPNNKPILKENDQQEKKLIEKEINCNCINDCWSGEKEIKKIKLSGSFPLKLKEDAQLFINQYNDKLVINELIECKVFKGEKCWSFSFNHPDSYLENGAAYGGCSYEGELNIETGDIDEGGSMGSLRTSP